MENKTTTTTELAVNRTYKSTVFTMLYADKATCWISIMLWRGHIIQIRNF